MAKLTDKSIKAWIKRGEHFDLRTDGGGLCLSFREGFAAPTWVLRYQFKGKPRKMALGSYRDVGLAEARAMATRLRAEIVLGHDPAAEKQARIQAAIKARQAKENEWTVDRLADEFLVRKVDGRLKHPDIPRRRIEKDIRPHIGKLLVADVTPMHVQAIITRVLDRGATTVATDVLRLLKKLFNHAVKLRVITTSPASAFDVDDAGGKEASRDRALSRAEITRLFAAMREAQGFSIQNYLTIKLLLLLGVRKQELTTARVKDFDLEAEVWHLRGTHTKTAVSIDIPLSASALEAIRELIRLGCSSHYLLPARKAQDRMLPHICESTLNVALGKVRRHLKYMEPFTIHDLRRTAKTQLAALGVKPHISERCLNHKIRGVEGVYDAHDYFEERRDALNQWAALLVALERGEDWNVAPMRQAG